MLQKQLIIMQRVLIVICFIIEAAWPVQGQQLRLSKKPVIVITDLYHPYQDPGDNLDLIMGYALPQVDLKAVILDITNAFRKDTADHPTLWKDPRGPREAGIIPVSQLNYIFDRQVPFAIGPLQWMRSETDRMQDSGILEQGVDLFLHTLQQSNTKVEVLSFGSARVLAVAFNRNPDLLRKKISCIHISAGMAAPDFKSGKDKGANMIPGGEWNVALDLFAFLRIMKSGLPIALYPCAGVDGGFVKDVNNTYWRMQSMAFLKNIDPRLQRYIDYAFTKRQRIDFLKAMDISEPFVPDTAAYPKPFHFWETDIWKNVTGLQLVHTKEGSYVFVDKDKMKKDDKVVPSSMIPVKLNIRNDGRFTFSQTSEPASVHIYYRADPDLEEKALQQAYPNLLTSFRTHL
jgi:pyrimidine-specific ribonucleoside hydrolase